jgi:exosortase C (VPDSG-CTERM-specific)
MGRVDVRTVMKSREETVAPEVPLNRRVDIRSSGRVRWFIVASVVLTLCYGVGLWRLFVFAYTSHLYSHVILVPFVSGYFIWLKRNALTSPGPSDSVVGAVFFGVGCVLIAVYAGLIAGGANLAPEDALAFTTASYLAIIGSLVAWFLGRALLCVLGFPLAFLLFMIPMPLPLTAAIETLLQHGSAIAALVFFKLSGMPVFNDSLVFQLPGFSLRIAPECSGIHSTLALFITSIVAGQLFLTARWKRVALAAFVLPLALLRNGFRVFVIGQLCVRIGPHMIDSFIHHSGGPIFFALSLVPFTFLLWLLARRKRASASPAFATST